MQVLLADEGRREPTHSSGSLPNLVFLSLIKEARLLLRTLSSKHFLHIIIDALSRVLLKELSGFEQLHYRVAIRQQKHFQ